MCNIEQKVEQLLGKIRHCEANNHSEIYVSNLSEEVIERLHKEFDFVADLCVRLDNNKNSIYHISW